MKMNINVTYFKEWLLSIFIYSSILPGVVKLFFLSFPGPLINVLSFVFLCITSASLCKYSIKFRFNSNFLSLFLIFNVVYLFLICTIYSLSELSVIDFNVFEAFSKSFITLVICFFIISGYYSLGLVEKFIGFCIFIGCVVLFYDIFFGFDMTVEGRNYLTLTMPILISANFLLIKSFSVDKFYIKIFVFLLFVIHVIYLISAQSRIAFIMLIICSFVVFYLKRKQMIFPFNYWYYIMPVILFISFPFVVSFLEKYNYVLYARIARLFTSDVTGVGKEDRLTTYENAINVIMQDPSGLGYGINASKNLFDLPYIESFALEYLLVFGFLGFLPLVFKFYFLFRNLLFLDKSKFGNYFYIVFLCLFSFFIKGWSVFDSFVIFIVIAFWIRSIVEYRRGRNVFNNNPYV